MNQLNTSPHLVHHNVLKIIYKNKKQNLKLIFDNSHVQSELSYILHLALSHQGQRNTLKISRPPSSQFALQIDPLTCGKEILWFLFNISLIIFICFKLFYDVHDT